jgi:hypothetical protein
MPTVPSRFDVHSRLALTARSVRSLILLLVVARTQFWGVVEDQLCRLQRFGAPTAQSPVTALYMRPYVVPPRAQRLGYTS